MRCAFRVVARAGAARAGVMETPYGAIATPAFFMAAPQGAAATLYPGQLHTAGVDGVGACAFSLERTQAAAAARDAGGLARFMGWRGLVAVEPGLRAMMAERGGRLAVSEEGVSYRAPRDGRLATLTPEAACAQGEALGGDIVIALAPPPLASASATDAAQALARGARWVERALGAAAEDTMVFAPALGFARPEATRAAAQALAAFELDGWALEGFGRGEDPEARAQAMATICAEAPVEIPRMALWAASPRDMARAVACGADVVVSDAPALFGARAVVWSGFGRVDLASPAHARDLRPVDEETPTRDYARAYLHALVAAGEPLGAMMATWSNVAYCRRLMDALGDAVRDDALGAFLARFP